MPLDKNFDNAARLVFQNKIGSNSFIQHRLNLSYSRAIQVISMLEQAGIVGPLFGAQPREVLPKTELEVTELIKKFKESRINSYENRRESIPQDVMDAVWNRDGGKCAI